jgi:hypothetical protein
MMVPERRRLLDRLVREIGRTEAHAADHAVREEKRIGGVAPPVLALREISKHATTMRVRFEIMIDAHDLHPTGRAGLAATLSTLRDFVADRVIDAERAYRTCLLDLRHGIDVVRLTREVARTEELFGIIRWCDDWLSARRTLVARVEAQLAWFAAQHGTAFGDESPASEPAAPIEDDLPRGTMVAIPLVRHEQDDASPEHRLGVHPSRTT